jgi:RNA polymerase sigma factor for flagellar operon FliA
MKIVAKTRRMLLRQRRASAMVRRRRLAAREPRPRLTSLRKPAARQLRKSPFRKSSLGRNSTLARKLPASDRTEARKPSLRKPPIPELWTRYASCGQGSKIESDIVHQYLPLVKTVVGRLAMTLPAHAATEDLYSAGLVGLLNAVRRFNPSTGVLFDTYARVRIRGAVFDELRRLDWVPRSVHDKARKVEFVMRALEQKLGRLPTNLEMAAALDISEEEYEQLLSTIKPATFVCLDSVRSAEQEGDATQHEAVADASQPDPGYSTARGEMASIIVRRLKHLPEVQRKVLALYYFEDLRLHEIAEVFGVTESRISQIHSAAVLALRSYLHKHDTVREAA